MNTNLKNNSSQAEFHFWKCIITIFFIVFLLTPRELLKAQKNDLYFEHISYKKNLSQVTVNSVLKDKVGFLWFGTEDGLNMYDGNRIKVYKHESGNDQSISHSAVWSIFEDASGSMWIGTFVGLNRYNRRMDSFITYLNDPEDEGSLSDNYVRALAEDNNGHLWVGTNMGLNRMGKDSQVFKRYYMDKQGEDICAEGNTINAMIVDHLGTLWIGTNNGLKVYNDRSDTFMGYNLPVSCPRNRITSLFEDERGVLWIGTEGSGLFTFDRKTESFNLFKLYHGELNGRLTINAISGKPGEMLWAGTDNGLYRISLSNDLVDVFHHDPFNEHSISDNNVRSLYSENNGFVWIGTISNGVNLVNPSKSRFHHVVSEYNKPNYLKDNMIKSFSEDKQGKILIGTEKGLSIYDPASGNLLSIKGEIGSLLEGRAIHSIHINGDNIYWFGIRGLGLIRYDKKNGNIRKYLNDQGSLSGNNVISIMEDNSGLLWIGTNGDGLKKFDTETEEFISYIHNPDSSGSISNNRIYSIIEDHLGEIWIATAGGGINRFNKKTGKFISYNKDANDTTNFSFNYILSVHEDKNGNIWAGTFGHGLILYSREEDVFTWLTESTGLPNNVIYGILEDDKGKLWLSHNQGISQFDFENEHFLNFDVRDGLQGNEFNSNAWYKCRNGTLLFGGNNGFNIFHPDSIRKNPNIPSIVFTDLKISNNKIAVGEMDDGRVMIKESIIQAKEINLLHSDREIYIEFSALDYSVPGKNRYKYKLEGRDDEWIDLGNTNNVSFHNLPYGKTILHVIGSNNDGAWNEEGVFITINVKPPFYSTVVFKMFGIIAMFGLMLLLYNLRMKIIKAQKKELELLIQTKTREIAQQRDTLSLKNDELESRNRDVREQRDRTSEMAKKLDEANQSKLQFFTNISHEFRTPLTLILGFVEKLLNTSSNNAISEKVDDYKMIEKNANKLLKLINRLMQFRKLTNKQTILKVSENNLVDFIRNQALLYKNLAAKKDISYTFEAKQKALMLWFDPEQLEEVITNLLSNAFKFSPNHSAIKVSVGQGSDPVLLTSLDQKPGKPGEFVYFSVEDDGEGISPEKQKLIFKRFYQVDHAKTSAGSGTGIGLHISDMIIKLHKGRISVKSAPEEGSVFTVLLRTGKSHFSNHEFNGVAGARTKDIIPDEDLFVADAQKSEIVSVNSAIEHLSKKDLPRIMIIEDNHELRKFILKGLDPLYNISGFENGEQALSMLDEFDPEVIICDVLLPGEINGFDFVERIKADFASSHIPVIMLTALDSIDQKVLGLEKGADIYMTKPFSLRELKAHIHSLIQSRITLKKKFREQAFLNSRELEISDKDESFIQKAIRIIEGSMSDPEFSVLLLCDAMSMSQTKLYRKLKALTDMTITDFIRGLRMRRASALILETDKNISEIAYEVGFNDPNYFGKCFKLQFGMSPSRFVKEHKSK